MYNEKINGSTDVSKYKSAFFWYTLLAVTYLILSLTLPVSNQTLTQLHINMSQYRALVFVVILPYILIWGAAFYSSNKMAQYSKLLGDAKEKPAFYDISRGIAVLAWGLAVPAIINTILKAVIVKHPGSQDTVTIINNYIALLVPLIAFTLIGNGSRRLSDFINARPSKNGMRLFALLFIALGVYYSFLTLSARKYHGNPYHLSREVTMFTIIVPYLYAWFMGFMNCYEIALYAKKIKGLLYKQALNLLGMGIAIVIGSTIFLQFITIAFAYKTTNSLGSILVVVYLLLITEAVGYFMIASGAKKLKRIEEI